MYPEVKQKSIDKYLSYLSVEKQYSKLTSSHYSYDLKVFLIFVKSEGLATGIRLTLRI